MHPKTSTAKARSSSNKSSVFADLDPNTECVIADLLKLREQGEHLTKEELTGAHVSVHDFLDIYAMVIGFDPMVENLWNLNKSQLLLLMSELPYASPDVLFEMSFPGQGAQFDQEVVTLFEKLFKEGLSVNAFIRRLRRNPTSSRDWLINKARESAAPSFQGVVNFLGIIGEPSDILLPCSVPILECISEEQNEEALEIYARLFKDFLNSSGRPSEEEELQLLETARALAN